MPVDVYAPIPDLDSLRKLKVSRRDYPIDRENPLFNEPLVFIGDYGLEGVSYYSQPNNATGNPISGVCPDIYVRKTVAEKLSKANEFLESDNEVARSLDGPVSIYLRDGFRSPELQSYLYDFVIPDLLRAQNPEWSEEQVQARIQQVIARPECSETNMPPHFTGGAVDAILKSAETGEVLNTGFRSVHLGGEAIHTDFLEKVSQSELAIAGLEKALMTRRVLYNVLTSSAEEVGRVAMVNNPTETWHYSYGDQMWAVLSGQPAAVYGVPEIPERLKIHQN